MIVVKNETLKFETFQEFINKAEEIREAFNELPKKQKALYCDYIYQHKFSTCSQRNETIKGKCWEWCLSLEYEPMIKNNLYCILEFIEKDDK